MWHTIKKIFIFVAIIPLYAIANNCISSDNNAIPRLTLGCPAGQSVMQGESGPYCVSASGKCLNAVMLNPNCPEQIPSQNSYHQDLCQTCGYYPTSLCPNTCDKDQKAIMKDGMVQFCVDADNNCVTAINFNDGTASIQEPYSEGACSMCGMYPTSYCPGTCIDGQTPISENGMISFCVNSEKQCLEKVSYTANSNTIQKRYHEGDCQACGLYPISNCPQGCKDGQKIVTQDGKPAFCVDEKNHACLNLIDYTTGTPSTQKKYLEGDCQTCGLYPLTQCPNICPHGQKAMKMNGEVAFCINEKSQCLTPINYTSGVASEQNPYNLHDCATCGLYPLSKCPKGCAPGQNTVRNDGEVEFCTNKKNLCLTPINYTSGQPSIQIPYTDNECSACGLYPTTACPSICATGQKAVKVDGNIAFCTDSNNQCWAPINYTSGNASKPIAYNEGDCKTCGMYPISNCPNACSDDQEAIMQDGQVIFCVDNNQKCLTAIDYTSGSASQQTPYQKNKCAICGQYPASSCPVYCKPGQKEAVLNDQIVFCVNSEYQCLTPISYNDDGSTNQQKSYFEGCCSSGYYGGVDKIGQFDCAPLN